MSSTQARNNVEGHVSSNVQQRDNRRVKRVFVNTRRGVTTLIAPGMAPLIASEMARGTSIAVVPVSIVASAPLTLISVPPTVIPPTGT